MSDAVTLVEVGPRDGLQNETQSIATADKIQLINLLAQAGLKNIEATAFVSPKWVPQMADNLQVLAGVQVGDSVKLSALVPNEKGLTQALQSSIKQIAVFTAASESFCQKNINCTIAESLERFKVLIQPAKAAKLRVRAYISCVLGCPYEGSIKPDAVIKLALELCKLGCDEISLGDTIGVGTPYHTKNMLNAVLAELPADKLAVHFHDTYGQALANILQAYEMGIRVVDSSVAGLGGCPYAKGATGNVASEDAVYMLNGMGVETGIDLHKLITAGDFINQRLQRDNRSKVATALLAKHPELKYSKE